MSDNKAKTDECIQVVVRSRPLNKKEKEDNRKSIITMDLEARQVSITNPDIHDEQPKSFTFDAVYDENTKQKVFYEESCFGVIESTLEGFNSTIFAYGQTGCGKSFTMQGPSTTDDEMKGVIPNSFSHIFHFVKMSKEIEFLIRCSYLELYNEEIRDLLGNQKNPAKCELKEDPNKGVYIKNLTDVVCESPDDLYKMLDKGLINRTVASTQMNSESSRSHSIFTIIIEMSSKDPDSGKDMLRVGKLNLVDLAGSERQKKTGAKDQTLKEGIKINLSLSALGNVISALSEGGRHIPYRDSKLTRLLQDSLGGNTKTMMIAAISPADFNFDETMSTLRYANRAKNIKNKPKINEDPKDTMIREFKAEIARLREMLAAQANGDMSMFESFKAFTQPPPQQHKQFTPAPPSDSGSHTISTSTQSPRVASSTHSQSISHSSPAPQKQAIPSTSNEDQYEESFEQPEGFSERQPGGFEMNPSNYSPDKDHMEEDEWGGEEERDKMIREGVEQRLSQLEGMLGHSPTKTVAEVEEGGEAVESKGQPPMAVLNHEEIMRELEEQERYKEQRLKAKKKKEAMKQREMQRILEEKKAVEMELEEFRIAALEADQNAADSEAIVKKMTKMKKRYEKKLATVKDELDDLREDFYYQRKQLMDAMVEQEKDAKLYELICRSVLTDKDLRKILDKCRYDEESDEWIIPFSKKKYIGDQSNSNQITNTPSSGGVIETNNNSKGLPTISNSSSLLPDINNKKLGKMNEQKGKGKNKKASSLVPLLTLPGNLLSAAAMLASPLSEGPSTELASGRSEHHGMNGQKDENLLNSDRLMSGNENMNPEKKKKTKKEKKEKKLAKEQKLASVVGDSNGDAEEGNGETAGPIDDWGFAIDDKMNGIAHEERYSDDEDFEKDGYPPIEKKKGKKKKKAEKELSNSLPPI